MSVLVEICCGSVEDVVEAERGGANRVELCSALPLGGLTPSAASIFEAKRLTKLPIMVMIRPRWGGFCYSATDFAVMEREIELAGELGADGFVFGCLDGEGLIEEKRTSVLVRRAGNLPSVFHRAFDVTTDPLRALDTLIDLGVTRVLTSGQQRKSLDGAPLIRELIERADDRIEILCGGGVRRENVAELIAKTGCRQVHLSVHRRMLDTSTYANRAISFGADSLPPDDCVDIIDASAVKAVVEVTRTFT